MSCCPPGSEPGRRASSHSGSTIQFRSATLYRAGPATAKIGLLAFPDVFGPTSGRTKADADRLGELGFAVVVVDAVSGDWLDPFTDYLKQIPEFIQRQRDDSVVVAAAQDAIAYLKGEAQVQQICSYGYCFGAWVGARLTVSLPHEIRGHVSFHPSWFFENMLYGDGGIEKLAHRLGVPQMLLSAGNDRDSLREGGSVEQILKTKAGPIGQLSRVVNFDLVKHGWVNRGELSDPDVAEAASRAWQLAVEFVAAVSGKFPETAAVLGGNSTSSCTPRANL